MNKTNTANAKQSFSGFLLLALVLAVIFIVVVLMPLKPSDYWTYLRIGEEIVRTHTIPTTEFMTYTSAGQPAVFSYWLASLAMLGIYRLGGLTLTALMMGLCVVVFYLFVWLCLCQLKLGPVSSSLILLVTAAMGSNNWSTRPQVFIFPLFGLTLLILIRWLHGRQRGLWLLPLVTLLWVNLHGSFVLLFGLIFTALVFGKGNRKLLLLVAALCLAITLVNPHGVNLWANTFGMIGNEMIATYSFEWQPPVNQGWQLNLFFGSLLIMAMTAAFSTAKVRFVWWVWFIGFGWMALTGVRYVVWYSVIAALLLGQLALPWLDRTLDRRRILPHRGFNLALGILVLISGLAFLPGIRQQWWQQAPANVSDTTPIRAVEWLKQHPELPGQLWGNWEASIYMSYALPERPVWITNRIEDFDEGIFLDNERLLRAAYNWQAILDSYDVNLLLLDQKYEKPLISAVSASETWQMVYQNDQSLVFVRKPKGSLLKGNELRKFHSICIEQGKQLAVNLEFSYLA